MGMQFIAGFREANAPRRPGEPGAKGEPGASATGDPAEAHPAAEVALIAEPATSATTDRLPPAIEKRMNGKVKLSVASGQLSVVKTLVHTADNGRSAQFAQFQSDAPACDNCGALTVRNGNCYLCHNCGNSLGCS
jgi:ribonucleoside-diphosphate reductase alpha chain